MDLKEPMPELFVGLLVLIITTALSLAQHHLEVNQDPRAGSLSLARAAFLVLGAALWLAGPDAAFVTGTSIVVDGGISSAGTRLYGRLGGTQNLDRVVGIAHGTTGQAASVRRL